MVALIKKETADPTIGRTLFCIAKNVQYKAILHVADVFFEVLAWLEAWDFNFWQSDAFFCRRVDTKA